MNSAELIMAYSKDLATKYVMQDPSVRYREVNRVCSDVVEVFLRIAEDRVEEFSFDGYLSVTATACVAITGELIVGQHLDDILALDESFIHENIGTDISPRRRYASLIGLLAIKNAIHQYRRDDIREDFSDIEVVA